MSDKLVVQLSLSYVYQIVMIVSQNLTVSCSVQVKDSVAVNISEKAAFASLEVNKSVSLRGSLSISMERSVFNCCQVFWARELRFNLYFSRLVWKLVTQKASK